MQTDAELCKIMTDYTENSYYNMSMDFSGVANVILCLPDINGKTAKETVFENSKELYEHELLGFYIDYTNLFETINIAKWEALRDKDIEVSEILFGVYKVNDDFHETAKTINSELHNAGIDEFTKEINRQYNEWREKKQ
jgi:hypothetical protein